MTDKIKELAKKKIYECKEAAYGAGTNASNQLEGDFGEWVDWERVLVEFGNKIAHDCKQP